MKYLELTPADYAALAVAVFGLIAASGIIALAIIANI